MSIRLRTQVALEVPSPLWEKGGEKALPGAQAPRGSDGVGG